MKFKFGGFLKQIFSRSERPAQATPPAPPVAETTPAPVAPAVVNGVNIPLASILSVFPLELRAKIRQSQPGSLTFTMPYENILPQLTTGTVKVKFGDIRRAAPQLFAPGIENDAVEVVLPLNEILPRLNPALLARRPTRKQLSVPDEIISPFAGRGQEQKFSVGNNNPASAAPTIGAPAPVTPIPRARPALVSPDNGSTPPRDTSLFRRSTTTPGAASIVTPAKEPIFARRAASPVAPAPPSAPPTEEGLVFVRKATPLVTPSAPSVSSGNAVAPTAPNSAPSAERPLFVRKPAAPAPDAKPASGVPPRQNNFLGAPPVARSVQPARAPVAAPASAEGEVLLAPLTALAEGWPAVVRQEIVQLKLVDAHLAMPVEFVEAALKRGRVVFSWKQVRSWFRPAAPARVSPHDATELELPLAVLAPLFLARQGKNGKSQRVSVDETIPNLFFGMPKPEPATTPKPADTNYYTWGDTTDKARVDNADIKRKSPGGTDFVAKYATPNEIVSRAAALDGVAGALIALPDGLMVANRIPAEYNGDTLAAFLPQIFSKVSQCTKELRMGDLNNLNFTVGNVPWKIFRVNAIFFAAFGHPSQPMPTADLVSLAAELDRRR